MTAPFTIAHRAGNSLRRLAVALAAGVDAIEIDVRVEGGRWVGRHDERIGFLPLQREKWRVTLALARPALLEEVLRRAPSRVSLLVDVKSPRRDDLLALLKTLKSHGPLDGMRMSSPFWDLMREAQESEPALRVYYSIGNRDELTVFWQRQDKTHEAKGTSIKEGLLDEPLVGHFLAEGIDIAAYNVDDLRRARELTSWGVAAVIADDYSMLRRLKQSVPRASPSHQ